jgi:hypothetical protein
MRVSKGSTVDAFGTGFIPQKFLYVLDISSYIVHDVQNTTPHADHGKHNDTARDNQHVCFFVSELKSLNSLQFNCPGVVATAPCAGKCREIEQGATRPRRPKFDEWFV